MNSIFLIISMISFLCIFIFLFQACIKLLLKRSAKKSFKRAGISALLVIASFIGFVFTIEDVPENTPDSVATISELNTESLTYGSSLASTAPTAQPTFTPTPEPTLRPTPTPTPAPTPTPTPAPTPTPTPVPTPTPTPGPTPTPTPAPTPTPTPAPTPTPTPAPTPTPTPVPTPEPTPVPTPEPTPQPTQAPVVSNNSGDSNFNAHDNPDQQNTTATYVLNTSSKKIHYPSCHSVKKIAPHNYSTSDESIETLKSWGYSTCGNCFK